ncbi:MAG TPA: hypothetical protein VHR55_02845 [Candidatus Limnocylindria bacterium]|nr:hypothetical protein [Candidatus Limnocylindria bacterium]
MQHVHEHKFRPQPAGGLTLRQFVESLRRWTPEMRQLLQIALTRTEQERRQYLQQFHAGHHERTPGPMDSFIRWAYSDPRIDDIPLLLAEIELGPADYEGALEHEADVLVRERAHGKTPAQRVADYLALLGMERSERVRAAIGSLLPPGTADAAIVATIRHMRRRWLELYGDDPFFGED